MTSLTRIAKASHYSMYMPNFYCQPHIRTRVWSRALTHLSTITSCYCIGDSRSGDDEQESKEGLAKEEDKIAKAYSTKGSCS